MKHPLNQTWDLDSLFEGGSSSDSFAAFLKETETMLDTFERSIMNTAPLQKASEAAAIEPIVDTLQTLAARFRQAMAFVECLLAQDQSDKKAGILLGRLHTINASYNSLLTRFDTLLTSMPDEEWAKVQERPAFAEIRFPLDERRQLALEKLPPEQEALINDLAVDGYHGWGEAYGTAVSHTRIPFEEADGSVTMLSAGQAHNKMHHHDRSVRKRVFEGWEKAWGGQEDYCADALNRLGGFRLQVYKHRGWKSVMKEPLDMNRMSEKTLNVMWNVVEKNKAAFVQFLQRKAKLMGIEKLAWYDVEAPVASSQSTVSYDQAADLIVSQFRTFSPRMADFAERVFEERWIEAEDRPGKRPGGFCTSLPLSEQTRIFMTFTGTMDNVSTLAHELGHAFHQFVMDDMAPLTQNYAMNVAETASTFAEAIVSNASIRNAATNEEKIALLDDKIGRSIAFFMNIHARIIFEQSYYERRRESIVSAPELGELMVAAQKKAFHESLSEYHPHFWASKLHFYATDVPFYNFPYTFGYLFSAGIYAKALEEGSGFEERYIALLRDTGSMTVEDLAHKHLGVDLTKPDFWQSAVDVAIEDVQMFLALTE